MDKKFSIATVIIAMIAGVIIGIFAGFGLYTTFVPQQQEQAPVNTPVGIPLMEQEFRGEVPPAQNEVVAQGPQEGEPFPAEIRGLQMYYGHPLSVIEEGRVVSTPESEEYYFGGKHNIGNKKTSIAEIIEAGKKEGKQYYLFAYSSATCPFCGAIYPYYRELNKRYGDILQIVSIYDAAQSTDDVKEKLSIMTEYNTGKPLPQDFDIITFLVTELETIQNMAQALGLDRIPQLYLVDNDGTLLFRSCEEDMGKIFYAINETESPIAAEDRMVEILENSHN
ncbi:hypothetical protein [uncultured Cloacibacillus sp.]|uniref:TlpA family protein disulfide reductase n=1 Tax=uncultured Cloacibacillus sp. TaxID=889794 RepID=UPI0026DD670B|nr:hypothetical protein [uncultured Cloacibacillus sp.]